MLWLVSVFTKKLRQLSIPDGLGEGYVHQDPESRVWLTQAAMGLGTGLEP